MARLELEVLGAYRTCLDGRPLQGFRSTKVQALLAYLVVEGNRPHSRESLAGLLWPDYPNRAALTYLRQALSNLRRVTADPHASPPMLLIFRDAVQLNPAGNAWLDLAKWERLWAGSCQAAATGHLPQAIAFLQAAFSLCQGEFMEGSALKDSVPFEEWLLLWRERCQRKVQDTLRWLVGFLCQQGRLEEALPYAWRQVELDPWREESQQQLMRLLATSGQRAAALAQFAACCRALQDELDVEPSPETVALYEQIRDAGVCGLEWPVDQLSLPGAVL